jgi:hypothetical protein
MYHTFEDQGKTYFVHSVVSFEYIDDIGADGDRVDPGDSAVMSDDSELILTMADGSQVTISGPGASSLHGHLTDLSTSLLSEQ